MKIHLGRLPATLWHSGKIHLAQDLQSAYVACLNGRELLELASTPQKNKEIYGGPSLKQTNDHFALRYYASAARVENILLDPEDRFGSIPADILESFASHNICLLDVPSGTGAGGIALICFIHELRVARLVPALPLNIAIIAGDLSEHALEIYREQMEMLKPVVGRSAIHVTLTTMIWDATNLLSTRQMCACWERETFQANERFVLVTNFSGAGAKMFEDFKEAFRHISASAADKNATLLWIEPGDKGGVSFLARVRKAIGSVFGKGPPATDETPQSEARWWHGLHKADYPVRSAVHKYTRPL